jgi:hypothetical protein
VVGLGIALLSPAYRVQHYGPQWSAALGAIVGWLWYGVFMTFGILTLAFAVLERINAKSRFLENWNPRRLPPVRDLRLIPRINSAIELAVNLAFFLWWAANAHALELPLGMSVKILFAPQWNWFFWSYLALAAVNVAAASTNLMRPYWTPLRAGLRLAADTAGALLFCALMKANVVVRVLAPSIPPERQQPVANAVNHWLATCLPIAVLLSLIVVATGIYRLIRFSRNARPGEPTI